MRPVGTEGERSFARLTALVERHLSSRHAAIFAEPVPQRDGGGIDWYLNGDGDVLPLSSLSNDDVAKVKNELTDILGELRKTADKLDASTAGNSNKTASALRNATTFPGDHAIFAVRSDGSLSPVIVAWGFESHDASAAHKFNVSAFGPARSGNSTVSKSAANIATNLSGETTTSDIAGKTPTTESSNGNRFGWLLPLSAILVSLLLVGWISALLLPACGMRTPFGTVTFGFPGNYACASGTARGLVIPPGTASLQQELAILQQNYQQKRLECAYQAPQPTQEAIPGIPALPAQVPQEERRFEERVDQRGDAQITLVWEGPDDLDLWLQCPDTTSIYYENRNACGGTLDIDQNAGSQASAEPIENITFPSGPIQQGDHRIGVQLFRSKSNQFPLPFQVRVRDKNGSRVLNGQIVREKEMVLVDVLKN